MYELSIKYHARHKDIGDNSGKFISNINLGLVYTKLSKNRYLNFTNFNISDDLKTASIYFQHALRCAIQLQDTNHQSVAIGNLGKIGSL